MDFFGLWAPPPPPPPPPSLHGTVGASAEEFERAAQACGLLALLFGLLALVLFKLVQAKGRYLVNVTADGRASHKTVVLRSLDGGSSELAQHTKRLLLQRGFNDVRCPQPGLVSEACKGADLRHRPGARGVGHEHVGARDTGLPGARAANGVGSVILCSDALVGYDPSDDVTDGDERWDAGPSLERLTPRVPVTASGRLLGLRRCEEALAAHQKQQAERGAGLVLRMHRIYSPNAAELPSVAPLLFASGLGAACAGARALTNPTHVEDAALGIVLAADKLLLGGASDLPPRARAASTRLCSLIQLSGRLATSSAA